MIFITGSRKNMDDYVKIAKLIEKANLKSVHEERRR